MSNFRLSSHVMKITFMFSSCLMITRATAQEFDYYLYIGTYTRKTSEGIYVYQFNSKTGDVKPVSITKGTNPSFLSISSDQRFLYALAGMKGDSVKAFIIDQPSHHLTLLNSQSLDGNFGACHLAVDKTGRWLIVGNYGSGSVTVLPIQTDGTLGKVKQTIVHDGKSINVERQDMPHVHSINIASNNTDVFVPDLGTDKIMTYSLNANEGRLENGKIPFTNVAAGSGPRHFVFHPGNKWAYVVQELNSTVTAFRYSNGTLEAFQTVKTLPEDYTGLNWSADIHISPDGKFLYASNRAHESLTIFSINKKTGGLSLVDRQPVNGKTPRNFAIDPTGNFVLVANQDSDNIVIFKRDHKTGKLTATGKEIKISQPVCLKFIP